MWCNMQPLSYKVCGVFRKALMCLVRAGAIRLRQGHGTSGPVQGDFACSVVYASYEYAGLGCSILRLLAPFAGPGPSVSHLSPVL